MKNLLAALMILVLLDGICKQVNAQKNDEVYMFSFFQDPGIGGLHLTYSEDGLSWKTLNNNKSFLIPEVGEDKLMRDPCITQGGDGKFHMVWTVSWGEKGIGYASSKDLIHWSEQKYIPVMEHELNTQNCWAPEVFYDKKSKQYLIHWATTIPGRFPKSHPEDDNNHRMYYCTTKDFVEFSETKVFYDHGFNVIDANLNMDGKEYLMFLKDETKKPNVEKNIRIARSKTLTGKYSKPSAPISRNWVEGPTAIETDKGWIVYFDMYAGEKTGMGAVFSTDLENWKDISDKVHFPEGTKHGSVFKVKRKVLDNLLSYEKEKNKSKSGVLAPKPAFRDPVYDGAADVAIVWNPQVSKWWMFYTNRRANQPGLPGVSWVHGTPIGIAESVDGANWDYLGATNFENLPEECRKDSTTLWAPEVIKGDDGKWHMYLSIVPGISEQFGLPYFIAHFTSTNLRDWKYERELDELGIHVIDAEVTQTKTGKWRMYYKSSHSTIYKTESDDLYTWSDPVEVLKIICEGPIAFRWGPYYWLIVDSWNGQTIFRSWDAENWEKQHGGPILPYGSGTGLDDIPNGLHANVVKSGNRVYMYYFTHPGRINDDKDKDTVGQRRTSIQVVELELNNAGWIEADRNKPTYVELVPPSE